MALGRRKFLGWVAAGAVAGGAGMAAIRASGYRVPREIEKRLEAFRAWHFVVVESIGARLLAPESADVGLFADQYAAGLPDRDRDDLLSMLAYVEHVAPLSHGLARRFSGLTPNEQDRVLAAIERSPIGVLRGGFQALKAVSMMALYRREASWSALGYSGPAVRWSTG
jgi:hypothetical protein